MQIAQVALPFESVRPARRGGTERVVATLNDELVHRGHDVTRFASGDSLTAARLVPIGDRALWHREPLYKELAPFWPMALGHLAEHLGEFDVIHNATGGGAEYVATR
jgi:hypothetical protein